MKLEVCLAQAVLPCADVTEATFLIKLVPGGAGAAAAVPFDLRFVLDRSWSMRDASGIAGVAKIDALKAACRRAVDRLRVGLDAAGAWSFADTHACIWKWKQLAGAADAAGLKRALDGLEPKVGTVFSGALEAALKRPADADSASAVAFMTDGIPYCRDVAGERKDTLALAELAGERGVTLLVFGTGVDYDERFLREVAARAGGASQYVHVRRLDEMAEELAREIELGGRAEATDVEVAVAAAPGAELAEVIAMLPAQHDVAVAGGAARERAGVLDARGRAYVVRAKVIGATPGTRAVAKVEVGWREGGRARREVREVAVELTGEAARVSAVDPAVRATVLSAAGARATVRGDLQLARTLYGGAGNATALAQLSALGTATAGGDEDAARALRTRIVASGLPTALGTAKGGA